MNSSCYFYCLFTQQNLGVLGGVFFFSFLMFALYKKSNSYQIKLGSLYLILGAFPFTLIYLALSISCSHGFCLGNIFEIISLGMLGSLGFLSFLYYFFGSRICLKAMGGKFLDEGKTKEIFDDLSREMGVKAKLAYINSGKPLAISISGSENLVILSIGTLEFLEEEEDEMRAVLAHELAHLKLRDPLIKFISRLFGLSYVYSFIADTLEMEQEKRANQIAEKFSSKTALKKATTKFTVN